MKSPLLDAKTTVITGKLYHRIGAKISAGDMFEGTMSQTEKQLDNDNYQSAVQELNTEIERSIERFAVRMGRDLDKRSLERQGSFDLNQFSQEVLSFGLDVWPKFEEDEFQIAS